MVIQTNNKLLSVTNDTRSPAIVPTLGERFTHHGELFLPDTDFYEGLLAADGLRHAANELFRWLGHKPYALDISYDDEPASLSATPHAILIPASYRENPYMVGASLGLQALGYTIRIKQKDGELDDSLIDAGSIECGFGILVLNGLQPRMHVWQSAYHHIRGDWHITEGLCLHSMSSDSYGRRVQEYIQQNDIDITLYWSYLNPAVTYTLPVRPTKPVPSLQPRPRIIHRQLHAVRLWWLRLGLGALAASLPIALGIYIYSQRSYQPDSQTLIAYQTVTDLRAAYDSCADAVKQQRAETKDDVFGERRLDATLSRCASLKNQYNYAVTQYNHIITQ